MGSHGIYIFRAGSWYLLGWWMGWVMGKFQTVVNCLAMKQKQRHFGFALFCFASKGLLGSADDRHRMEWEWEWGEGVQGRMVFVYR